MWNDEKEMWHCTRCNRLIKNYRIGWLSYDQNHDLYIDFKRSCEIGRSDHPDATAGMTDSEVGDYLDEIQQTLGTFPFGPECVKQVNGKTLSELREKDKNKSNPKDHSPYWGQV